MTTTTQAPQTLTFLQKTRHTVYCIHSTRTKKGHTCDRSYIGYTVGMRKRLRQHNGELVGGAKATSWCSGWRVVWTVTGFETATHALQLEWRLHHPNGRRRGRRGRRSNPGGGRARGSNSISRRTRDLYRILTLPRFTSKAPPTENGQYTIRWYDLATYETYAKPCVHSYIQQGVLNFDEKKTGDSAAHVYTTNVDATSAGRKDMDAQVEQSSSPQTEGSGLHLRPTLDSNAGECQT